MPIFPIPDLNAAGGEVQIRHIQMRRLGVGEDVDSLLAAWVLTLPVCIVLGSGFFSAGLSIVFILLDMR